MVNIKENLNSVKGRDYVFDVPDALFMLHMTMYGTVKFEQMNDKEFQTCTMIGLRSSMKYEGPADPMPGRAPPTNKRKDK